MSDKSFVIKIDKQQLKQLILDGKSTEEYDYSEVTDMSYMFRDCKSLTTIPLIDTSNVTDMRYMFSGLFIINKHTHA